MRLSDNKGIFLSLVRLGIAHHGGPLPNQVDWEAIKVLAEKQGLSAVVVDGIEQLPKELMPSKLMLIQWIGEVTQNYEVRYEQYIQAITELAAFYNAHSFKMMVLKGYACSLDWPKPNHRPCGDIDIWQFGQYKAADTALIKEKGIKIDNSHHHHTVFNWRDFMVENHYDFINVHHHKSHVKFEKVLKELGNDDSISVEVDSEKVYLPSPNLHALFLFKHLTLHFSTGEINFRQLLDWAFFVEKHGKEVDWKWFEGISDQFGIKTIYGILNAICVENLGFDSEMFSYVQFDPNLKERVLNEILSPEFQGEAPKGLFRRICFKFRRWKANKWKHELCFKESMWSALRSGVWNHLLKPSSI